METSVLSVIYGERLEVPQEALLECQSGVWGHQSWSTVGLINIATKTPVPLFP